MLGWLTNLFGRKREVSRAEHVRVLAENYALSERYRKIKASYDAAKSNPENRRHWMNADALSSRGANDPDTRKILRERSRYEVANNCHARGITLTMANDMIGTGARLQALYDDEGLCDAFETAWEQWATEVMLAEKLHTFALATVVDGEAFALLTTNGTLASPVKLDVRPIECDHVTTPQDAPETPVDGIEYDRNGNPSAYHVLRQHPGDTGAFGSFSAPEFDRVLASNVLHWFRPDRPQQARGIPELTPALPIFSQLRRYTLATLMAAEIAADFAMFIQTEMAPGEGDFIPSPFSSTDIDKGLITALPHGYKAFQLKAEQPGTSHDQFTKTLLREACHCLNIPYNIATADFSEDSYAGGRMAQGVYQRYVEVRRKHFMARVLDRIFAAWLREAMLLEIFRVPKKLAATQIVPHTWFFDEWVHVDPLKEANATQVELLIGTATLAGELAKKGIDWRKHLRQRNLEYETLREGNSLVLPPGTPPLDGTPQGQAAAAEEPATTRVSEDDAGDADTVLEDAGVA